MYWLLASVGASVLAALFLGLFWDEVRDNVAAKLRHLGLSKGVLMDAWIELDKRVSHVRSRIFVKTRQNRVIKVSEKTHTLDEIDDPEIRQLLLSNGYCERHILEMIE